MFFDSDVACNKTVGWFQVLIAMIGFKWLLNVANCAWIGLLHDGWWDVCLQQTKQKRLASRLACLDYLLVIQFLAIIDQMGRGMACKFHKYLH